MLLLNFGELLLGGWLGIFYAIDNFGSLDWRVTLRAFSSFFIGFALLIHGGVSVTLMVISR